MLFCNLLAIYLKFLFIYKVQKKIEFSHAILETQHVLNNTNHVSTSHVKNMCDVELSTKACKQVCQKNNHGVKYPELAGAPVGSSKPQPESIWNVSARQLGITYLPGKTPELPV
jgi:hypothetical protein